MDVAPRAAAEAVEEVDEDRRPLPLLAPAAVDHVGLRDPGAGGEGALVRLERLDAHRDDLLHARREAGHEAVGEAPLGLGVEEKAADTAEGGLEGADAGVVLVVEARDEKHLLRHGEARLSDQGEEVGPRDDAVVVGGVLAQPGDEGGGVDAGAEPLRLLGVGEAAAAGEVDLQAREGVDLQRVGREAPDRHPVALERSLGQLVRPVEMVLRAGAEQLHAVPEPDRVLRQRVDQRLGAADGAGLVQARGDEGEVHFPSSASMRALSSATSFLWRRSMISIAARRTLFVWFCWDQRR